VSWGFKELTVKLAFSMLVLFRNRILLIKKFVDQILFESEQSSACVKLNLTCLVVSIIVGHEAPSGILPIKLELKGEKF